MPIARTLRFVALLAAVTAAAGSQRAFTDEGPAYLLRYAFRPNQFVHYEVRHDMTLVTQKGSVRETVASSSTTRQHYRVVKVAEDGSAVIEPVIDEVQLSARFDDQEPIRWSSRDGTVPPEQFAAAAAGIGKSQVRLEVAASGELKSVFRLQWPAALPSVPVRHKHDREADPLLNFLVVFPQRAVRVGESWHEDLEVPVTLPQFRTARQTVKLRRTYTLEAVEDDVARIRLVTSLLAHVSDGGIRAQLIQRLPTGVIRFDLGRGLLVSRELTVDRQEVGIHGDDSQMLAKSRHTEELLAPERVAAKDRAFGPAGPPEPPRTD